MSEPPVDTSAEAVEGMICSLHGHPAQAMMRALKRERGELRQRVLEAEKAARVTLEQAERAGPCFKSVLLREAVLRLQAELAADRRAAENGKARSDFTLTWALVRAAGGKIMLFPYHLDGARTGRLESMDDPATGARIYRAIYSDDAAPKPVPPRAPDPTAPCREEDRAAGRPYPKSSCPRCGWSAGGPPVACARANGGAA